MRTALPTHRTTLLRWLFCTTYGRIYLTSHLLHRQRWRTYTPLPRRAAVSGVARDPTEYDAMKFWATGIIPNRNYNGKYARLPRRQRKVRTVSRYEERQVQQFLQSPQKKHADCAGRECIECRRNYPLTKDYWHVDKYSAGGFRTICKRCRNPVERERIAGHRAAA